MNPRPVRPASSLAAALVVSTLALLVSCLPGLRAPDVPPAHSLELSGPPPAVPPSSAFAVVFAAPRGEVRDPSEVSLLFNRPMRPLELAGEESSPPARIVVRGTDQAPRGVWRWMGTSALVFAPEARLPYATEFVVTVPAGTRSLDGQALAAPFEMSFSTPRPQVERLTPGEDDELHDQLVPGQTFEARFDQPVDPRVVERALSVVVKPVEGNGAGRTVAVHVSRPDAGNPKLVKIVPSSPLPLASKIALTFDASLRGQLRRAAADANGEPQDVLALSTYEPLQVVKARRSTAGRARAAACPAWRRIVPGSSCPTASRTRRTCAPTSALRRQPPIAWSTEPRSPTESACVASVTLYVPATAAGGHDSTA